MKTPKEKAIKEAVKIIQNRGLVSNNDIKFITMMAIKKGIDIAIKERTIEMLENIEEYKECDCPYCNGDNDDGCPTFKRLFGKFT